MNDNNEIRFHSLKFRARDIPAGFLTAWEMHKVLQFLETGKYIDDVEEIVERTERNKDRF